MGIATYNPEHSFYLTAGVKDTTTKDTGAYLNTIAFYIDIFKNNQDAKFYDEEVVFYENYMKEQLTVEKFGQKYIDDTSAMMSYPSTTYVYKNVTLTMSNNYSDEKKEEWIQKMETAVDNSEFE